MYCRRCGTENPPDSAYCVSCGEQIVPPGGPTPQAGAPQPGPPPGWAQPGYPPAGYSPQQPGYGTPGAPPPSPQAPKKSAAGLVIVLASLGVLMVGGAVAAFALLGPREEKSQEQAQAASSSDTAEKDKSVPRGRGGVGVAHPGGANVPSPALPPASTKRYRIYPRPHNATLGPEDALVTVIMVGDSQCPFTSGSMPAIEAVRKRHPKDVRVVYMHFPLSNHSGAREAAVAAQAAAKQGKFWEYQKLLFENRRKQKKDDLLAYAAKVGLDVGKFKKDLDNRRLQSQVTLDMQQVRRLGVRGTPVFFVNGVLLRGRQRTDQLEAAVKEELAHARQLVAQGTARAQVYRTLLKDAQTQIADAAKKRDPYRPRPSRPTEDPDARYKVAIDGRPYRGAKHAPVVITYYSDFQCPWCRRLEPKLEEVLKKYPRDVKIVWMDFPLRFHKMAMPSAIAAHEVFRTQGNRAFWKLHKLIFDNNRSLSVEQLEKWARSVGASGSGVAAALTKKAHESRIRQVMLDGQRIGVRGTPTILINGKRFKGRRDLSSFSEKIDAELREARRVIRNGSATRKTYYAYLQKRALDKVKYLPGSGGAATRPRRKELDPDAVYKVVLDGKSPSLGPKSALVTIVQWSDFQCPYCKWAACIVKLIHEAFPRDVRIVFKNNPLGFHKEAMPAALAARAAYELKGNRAFWTFHDGLFPTARCSRKAPMPHIREWLRGLPRPAPKMDRNLFLDLARKARLKRRRYVKALGASRTKARIVSEQKQAVGLGARGTPSFFINGRYIRGVRPFARMKSIITEALQKARKLMKGKRLKRSRVYQAIIANGVTAPVYK